MTRGRFAEFIVAHALGINVKQGVRKEWDACDLITSDGIKVEVKTSAYVQTWRQTAMSRITWSLGPTRAWVDTTNEWSSDIRWQADVYVLALFASQEKGTTHDPLDLTQWRFFVLPVRQLEIHTRKVSLTLQGGKALGVEGVTYAHLADAVRTICEKP